jgi:hypothetical protein
MGGNTQFVRRINLSAFRSVMQTLFYTASACGDTIRCFAADKSSAKDGDFCPLVDFKAGADNE